MLDNDQTHGRTGLPVRDRGMTLPELLISVSIVGLIAAVLSSAIIVTFRQADSTQGRINVARAEQSVDTWLPADLASTDVTRTDLPAVDTDPAATPCGNCGSIDMSGANALQLAWNTTVPGSPPVDIVTRVQYQYIQVGAEWQLQRIECVGGNACTMRVVLHDLEPPSDLSAYDPDLTKPTWVLDVSAPEDPAELNLSDNARRILVTINGGGSSEGAGGGANTVSLTAGGVQTSDIEADDFTVPAFVRAKSRCGGPVSLVIDDSGSIGGAVNSVVKPGVAAFIEAFRGTPTQIQVVQFSSAARAIGPGGGWHRYFDMTKDDEVDDLKDAVNSALVASGGTNWEEAFFHTLKNADGSSASELPNRIVFFTDGIPTVNRSSWRHSWDPYYGYVFHNGDAYIDYNDGPYSYSSGWNKENGNAFHQESFDRADVILDDYRGIDLIFVGVGAALGNNVDWVQNLDVYNNRFAPEGPKIEYTGREVIELLLTDGSLTAATPAIYDAAAGEYTNPDTADLYIIDTFDATAFGAAMRAAALKDCGGTLTIQTRLPDGTSVGDEFVYENVEYRDDNGDVVPADARRVTTSAVFRTGTFDFEIPATVDYFDVDVVPQELETLGGYTPVGWSCRAGATAKPVTDIPIPSSPWTGITVQVRANEAVSCILEVSP